MNASTHTPTLAHAVSMLALADTAANPGMRSMRRTLAGIEACAALGLAPRPGKTPAAPQVNARKPKPAKAPARDTDTPEQTREWRVGVLVSVNEGGDEHTCVWVSVTAPGMRRAARQARAEAYRAGHAPVGVCAVLRDDAPEALLAIAA